MSEITPGELSTRLETENSPLVLDIRHREAFEDWHIRGSTNIDVYDALVDDPAAAKGPLGELPEDEEIVTICTEGVVSQTATDVLQEMGYDAATLEDGMSGWSRVHRHDSVSVGIDGELVQVTRPGKGCLSHVVISESEAAVFDASSYLAAYEAIIDDHDADLVAVFDTHAHADHVSGGADLAASHDAPYYLHGDDALDIDVTPLDDDQTISVGAVDITVIHTPGHSEGSVSFDVDGAALLTGDTLFHDSVGRVELGVEAGIEDSDIEANAATLYESLQRLLAYPDDILVLPAHDPGSPDPPVLSTLGAVMAQNEDLQRSREEFIETLASDIPDYPPNFERVKQVNVGRDAVDESEVGDLELGPNNCAAK